ncbi:hypothetical protein BGZ83_011078, partial [Gryganskiella cystojenkinii]
MDATVKMKTFVQKSQMNRHVNKICTGMVLNTLIQEMTKIVSARAKDEVEGLVACHLSGECRSMSDMGQVCGVRALTIKST